MNRKQFIATLAGISIASANAKVIPENDNQEYSIDLNLSERCAKIASEAAVLSGPNYSFGFINRQGEYKNLLTK